MNLATTTRITNDFNGLKSAIASSNHMPVDFRNLQRKYGKYLKTSVLGDTIFLRIRFTNQGIRITRHKDLDGFPPRFSVYSNNFPNHIFDITADSTKELLSKIIIKHRLLNIDSYAI